MCAKNRWRHAAEEKRGLNAIGHKRIFPGLVSRAKEEDKRKKGDAETHTQKQKQKARTRRFLARDSPKDRSNTLPTIYTAAHCIR